MSLQLPDRSQQADARHASWINPLIGWFACFHSTLLLLSAHPVLHQAYATSCNKLNVIVLPAQVALTLPVFWDGPNGIHVPIGGLVVTVGTGAFLAMSALIILSKM